MTKITKQFIPCGFIYLFKLNFFNDMYVNHIIGVLHNLNNLIRLLSLFSLMVECPCLFTQDIHINNAIQWIQICNPYACVQMVTLNDHYKANKSGPIE